MIYYTSDLHFGHARIIEFCNRPFKNSNDMDEELIKRWNNTVQNDDTVYILGDFAFASAQKAQTYLDRLNGQKHLILGNHDKIKDIKKMTGFMSVDRMAEIRDGDHHITLCHYPMISWNKSHHGSLMLYGHEHGNMKGNSQSLDVGVDCWNYTPVNLQQILGRMSRLPKYDVKHH